MLMCMFKKKPDLDALTLLLRHAMEELEFQKIAPELQEAIKR